MNEHQSEASNWTIQSLLRWATEDFKKRGLDAPRLEAELLLAHTLAVDRVKLVVDATRPLGADELTRYKALILRRRRGEPMAYIVGHREFYGRSFRVDSRVLIPRPDTECLVDVALARTQVRNLFGRALDLCTGSGCVAISLAKARPTWQVTGSDSSADALAVARDNALRLGALWGVRFALGDLFEAVAESERFELVTANPPYIASEEISGLAEDIREHEPRMALDGGASGLDFYQRLAKEAPRWLTRGGVLALEVGFGQATDVRELLAQAGFVELEVARDYGGVERVVSGKAPIQRPG